MSDVLESVTLLTTGLTGRRVPFLGRSLTGTQLQALYRLAHARVPVTPSRLAAYLGVTAGAVTQLVDGLRAEQLVDVAPLPGDARSRILTLTPAAAAEVLAFERGVVGSVMPRFAGLSDDDLTTLAALLARIEDTP
ncbi:MarR family winged helix-turn-helix transcriptional regulator [Marisediminicola senii]|uniref:MarR family winged helix-turn-helix transcriptional regulator n=1 Tax=Marisediminicola senii TaxID=2711233 RepID=UPI0013EA131A|nr:MarR family transcriptional regulator [Marisediminicola senii]